jgi:hypothetical protein
MSNGTIEYKYRVWCVTEGAYVNTDWLTEAPTECPNDPGHTIDPDKTVAFRQRSKVQQALIPEAGSDLETFLDGSAIVTDSLSSVSGPFFMMQPLVNRREIFNDVENPLYVADHTPLIGATGSVTNLNNIHSKLGWHAQQVEQARFTRPKDLLVFYGWPNAFNSAVNGWNNEKVAQDMSKYGLIVLGAGLEDPGHGDYANTQTIVARIKQLNPCTLIFGYVDGALAQATFETNAGKWKTNHGVHGIFCDKFGYDWGNTRAQQNAKIDYLHGESLVAFVNAWNTDHVLGTANDPSYPNTTYNPTPDESNLSTTDWILLESLSVNTDSYTGTGGYAPKSDWAARIAKMVSLRAAYGVNFASLGIVDNGNVNGQDLFNFSFVSAMMASLEANGTSDSGYAGSSSAVDYWIRPDVTGLGTVWNLNCAVQIDVDDADVYHRYVEFGHLMVDFSSGAQTSSIAKS